MHRHICFDKGGIKENKSRCCCREKVKDEYIRKMIEKTSTLKVGMPNNQTSDIVCLVSEEAALKYQKELKPEDLLLMVQVSLDHSNNLLVDGNILELVMKE